MPRPVRSALHLAAAALLAAAVGLVLSTGTAGAATCSSAEGVSVVVDFHELGGGVQSACVANGGTARSLFGRAGYALEDVQRQPGFVCRVDGAPALDDEPCVSTPPADAYWGLWSSDGTSGKWTYATTSAGSLKVPDGGAVAFSWNGSASRSTPGVSPAVHPASPTTSPSAKPTRTPQPSNTPKPTKNVARPTPSSASSTPASPSPSDSASVSSSPSAVETTPSGAAGKPTKSPGGVDGEMLPPDVSPSDGSATETSPVAAEPADPDGGLPTWVGPVVVVLLFAAGGAVAVVRRRGNASP